MTLDIDIGDGADALTINQLRDALDGTYWISGWGATSGMGDYEVDIASGEGAVDGTTVETESTATVDLGTEVDPDSPRKVVVYVDESGVIQYVAGDPAPARPSGETRFRTYDPAPPAIVSGVVVAEVWIDAGATAIAGVDIRDRRVGNTGAEGPPSTTVTIDQTIDADSSISFDLYNPVSDIDVESTHLGGGIPQSATFTLTYIDQTEDSVTLSPSSGGDTDTETLTPADKPIATFSMEAGSYVDADATFTVRQTDL